MLDLSKEMSRNYKRSKNYILSRAQKENHKGEEYLSDTSKEPEQFLALER